MLDGRGRALEVIDTDNGIDLLDTSHRLHLVRLTINLLDRVVPSDVVTLARRDLRPRGEVPRNGV